MTQHPLHGGSRLFTICKLQRFLAHCLQFIHLCPGQTGRLYYHCGYRPHTYMCVYRLYACMCLHAYTNAQHMPAWLRVASWEDVQLEWTFVHSEMAEHDKPAGRLFLTVMAMTTYARPWCHIWAYSTLFYIAMTLHACVMVCLQGRTP